MPATAHKLAISDSLVDINEATARELREALPGIGDILARRIVLYRDEHGPFETLDDLRLVPGINGQRLSKFAPRVSVVPPNSGFRVPAASTPSGAPSDDYVRPMPIFSIESDSLPAQLTPSMSSLLPDGPEEEAFFSSSVMPEEEAFFMPSVTPTARPEEQYEVGGSLLAGPRLSVADFGEPTPSRRPEIVTGEENFLGIPFHRPVRIGVMLVAIGLFSALVGSVFGIRSQEGGPRARLEQRVGGVEGNVSDLAGSVRALEGQASSFASSINALDVRVSRQAQEPVANLEAPPVVLPKASTSNRMVQSADASGELEPRAAGVRHRVRQAMRELDSIAPPSRSIP
jgi:competence ComEA-like helix-hairpin-helix protein